MRHMGIHESVKCRLGMRMALRPNAKSTELILVANFASMLTSSAQSQNLSHLLSGTYSGLQKGFELNLNVELFQTCEVFLLELANFFKLAKFFLAFKLADFFNFKLSNVHRV